MSKNREQWLQQAVRKLRPLFKAVDAELPDDIQVSCGFPGGGSARKRIGECWPTTRAGGVSQVFVSPTLDDSLDVLAVLVHELVHVWNDCKDGHKGPFAAKAKGLGLEGKMTATVAGKALLEQLRPIADKLGEYPHKAITLSEAAKQSTRMIKVVCPSCEYTLRTTRKWIEYGLPTCCCGEYMEVAE